MSENVNAVLSGSVAMASLVAALFFLRFWRRTRDSFFMLFSLAFAVDAVSRFSLAVSHVSDENEPLNYLARLVTFGLIIVAIIRKNRPAMRGG